jgi:hypothetical protein
MLLVPMRPLGYESWQENACLGHPRLESLLSFPLNNVYFLQRNKNKHRFHYRLSLRLPIFVPSYKSYTED